MGKRKRQTLEGMNMDKQKEDKCDKKESVHMSELIARGRMIVEDLSQK